MTMSWADSVEDSNHGWSRPTRPSYVPPPLRNKGFAAPDERPSRGGGGGGGGGGRRSRGDRRRAAKAANREPNPFDLAHKFAQLEVEDSNSGINFDAYEDIPVEVSGAEVPPAVSAFAEIDLGEALNLNIERCKYVRPTPVQRHAIPIAVAGRDLMACAQTGSGKTAAFCFPIISGIMKNHLSFRAKGAVAAAAARWGRNVACPIALILSPTRELSCQIHEEAKKFAYQTGVRVAVAYGGAPMGHQLRELEKGVDILVATPGRLVDLIERARVSLKMINYLTLDEADRMLDMGFEPQIRRIVQQMDMPPPGARQTMLFSATFPTEIQRLASDFLSNYIFLAVGRVGSSTDLIEQRVEFVEEMDKRAYLMDLLHPHREKGNFGKLALILVFVETKRGADALEHWLSMNGFPATAIHGDKVQMERERALRLFKSGVAPILVATDVAARGLDIPHVAHVINFDLPKDIDDYVHRIGRTGRAGKCGLATAFFNEGNLSMAKPLAELMQEANQEVPPWLTQYAQRSPYGGGGSGGRNRRHGGGRFGGFDYRRDGSSRGGNYTTSSYYDSGYPAYASAPCVYANEPVGASGWD
ncbi:hypothetical protein Sjap_019221 [Stephania japonica]|uniref:RNA helicase n=1 Tax=Stephania japonica TaxID=461633 RepID=A0AAP0HXZ1_9MAGN